MEPQLFKDPNGCPVDGEHHSVDTFKAKDVETIVDCQARGARGDAPVPVGAAYGVSDLSAEVGWVEGGKADGADAFAKLLRDNCPAKALSSAEGATMEFQAIDDQPASHLPILSPGTKSTKRPSNKEPM